MATAKLYDLARMTTATTGTGTVTLVAAVSGFNTFANAGVVNGDVIFYAISDGANGEIGTGTYSSTGPTLTRSVIKSTNSNAAISLSGTAQVFISPPAEGLTDAANLTGDASGLTSAKFAAGTASQAPLQFTAGTNLTSALAGAVEYDGTAFYASLAANSRGVVHVEQVVVLSAAYTLTSQTAAQKLFNATTNGALTLPVGTYEFECQFSLSAMSTTSGSFGFALGGTATFTQAWWSSAVKAALATATADQNTYNTAANTSLATANTTATGYAYIRGRIRVTVAGTVIPQVSLTIAAAAVVGANSFFRIAPVGPSAVTNVGNWS